jgi:phosphohistidine phosphatase
MVRVYLVRHGADAGPGDDGALSGKGRRRMRRAARAFAQLREEVDHLFASPLLRAIQSAEILAAALEQDEVEPLDELLPGTNFEKLLEALARRVRDGQGAALVGHEPQLSQLAAKLGDLPPLEAQRLSFRKGAIARFDVAALPFALPAAPCWWVHPKTGTLQGGPPLEQGD